MNSMRYFAAVLATITALLFPMSVLNASAPQQKGQAPGYYRMMLGDFEIVALSDGTLALEIKKILTKRPCASTSC